jgi:hypothetical protein
MGHPTDPRNVRGSHVPRIGGMLEDADLDGVLRLGGRADPPTHQSDGRYTQSPRAEGLDISWSVPSRLPLVERPGGDTLSACLDLGGT